MVPLRPESAGAEGYRVPVRTPARPRPLRSGRFAAATLLGSAVVLTAVPARAAPTCAFDAQTGIMTVLVGTGETAVLARSGDAIMLDGVGCDTATVTTTDSIVVDGSVGGANVTLDLSGGPFEPGMTPDPDGTSEIEITLTVPGAPTVLIVGSAQADHFVLGADGANLNAAEASADADVLDRRHTRGDDPGDGRGRHARGGGRGWDRRSDLGHTLRQGPTTTSFSAASAAARWTAATASTRRTTPLRRGSWPTCQPDSSCTPEVVRTSSRTSRTSRDRREWT